nr:MULTISPECIES: transposase [unclassified Coleofasciculus]
MPQNSMLSSPHAVRHPKSVQNALAPKPTKAEKAAQGKTGFVVVATRWVIERSNAWMKRCKSLVKNFERTLSHARAKFNLCFIRANGQKIGI